MNEDKKELDNNFDIQNAAEVCYNIIKEEYIHTFTRSDKLDNKVYIALTFCAFIFLFVLELLGAIVKFKFPTEITQLILIILYVIVCIVDIGLFLFTLVKLAKLLKPMKIDRINPSFIITNNMHKHTSSTVYTFVSTKYTQTINKNNEELEKRFIEYNKCISKIIWIVILAFSLNTVKIFIC